MSDRFRQQDSRFYKKLGNSWRKANGGQGKMRKKKRGAGKMPNVGYGTPVATKFTVNGRKVVKVFNASDLEKMSKDAVAVLSSSVGKKRLLDLSEKARQMGIEIFNKKRLRKARLLVKKLKQAQKPDNTAEKSEEGEEK